MKITKRHLRRLVKEARFGMQMPRGSQPPLDVPMRDSGPVPKDQLRKLADIFMKDMGMSADEVLQNPEFVEQGITDLRQLGERKIKITKRQLKRIIKEAIKMSEPITLRPGSAFNQEDLGYQAPKKLSTPGEFKDTIVMSPTGDSVLVGGEETHPDELDIRLVEIMGQQLPRELENKLSHMVMKQMADGYVEIPISWSPNTGWKF